MTDLVERLQKECDRHVIGYPGPRRDVAELLQQAKDELSRLQKEIETAREALEPFGKLADVVLGEAPAEATYVSLFIDCQGISHRITLDQLRTVQRALKDKEVAG